MEDKKDLISLQWFLNEYDKTNDDYASYINVKINGITTLDKFFKIENSIITFIEKESKMSIYSVTSNNKVLKISIEKRHTEHHKDYDIRVVTYELFSNASDYYIETADISRLQIVNSSGKKLTSDCEALNISPDPIVVEKIKLTDMLEPINIEELEKTIGEVELVPEEENKTRKKNKGLVKALFDD